MALIEDFLHPKNNVEEVSSLICELLNLKLTKDTLCRHLQNHPFYPSMLAIHDVFEEFGIVSEAYKLEPFERILDIKEPFLLQVKTEKENGNTFFALVYGNDGETADWFNPISHRRECISFIDLKKKSTNYAMLFSASPKAGDKIFVSHWRKETLQKLGEYVYVAFLPICLILIAIYRILSGTLNLYSFLYATLLLVGCIVCGLLLMHEYNAYNPVVRSVCGGGQKMNCDAVLSSPGSAIAGIPWSVIGGAYFLGSLIFILESCLDIMAFTALSYINLLTLPYTGYSLYYQKVVVKQWCPLCLSVLAITWCLFVISLIGGAFSFSVLQLLPSFICFVVSMSISALLTYMIWRQGIMSRKLEYSAVSYRTIKYNKGTFEALLQKEKKVKVPVDGYGLILGNPEGTVHIIEACNPLCGHCGIAHGVLCKLLEDNPNVCLQIMFVMGPDDAGYDLMPIDLFLTLSKEGKDMSLALKDWYAQTTKDAALFGREHAVNLCRNKENDEEARKMSYFCKSMEITHTPTFFINGHELPDLYHVGDLKYFV